MELIILVFLIALGISLLGLFFKLLKAPLKWAFKLFLHALLGFIFLFIFNFFGAWAGLHIGLNWINAIVTGVLGVPGVILLLLIQFFL